MDEVSDEYGHARQLATEILNKHERNHAPTHLQTAIAEQTVQFRNKIDLAYAKYIHVGINQHKPAQEAKTSRRIYDLSHRISMAMVRYYEGFGGAD